MGPLCCLIEVGSIEMEIVDLLEQRLQTVLCQLERDVVFFGQFLEVLGLKFGLFHLGIVHKEIYLNGAEVIRQEMVQGFALLIVEHLGLRSGGLGMQNVLWCEMVVVISIGTGGVEDIE